MALTVQRMNLDGVELAMEWAELEGWQPGRGDARCFYAADPDGFFQAVEGKRIAATISVVRGSPKLAFVGLYIVIPELRSKGNGRALWDEAVKIFDGFTLGLDAVPEQVGTYESEGFVSAHGNARFSVDAASLPEAEPSGLVGPASLVASGELIDFDAAHFFGPRPDFLHEWITGKGRDAVVAVENGAITGFAASRPTSSGFRIGPIFARDTAIAREMLLTLAAGMKGPVSIDLPQPNHAAVDLVESLGMQRSFETTRMYRGKAPDLPLERIYGITSLELG